MFPKMVKIILVIIFITFPQADLCFGQSSQTLSLNCQIVLDDARNFNFSNLRAFIQYRQSQNSWKIAGENVFPDKNGRFIVTLPKATQVSIVISTSDPTIRHSRSASEAEFYSFTDGGWETVARLELAIPQDSTEIVSQIIKLQRGAAFYPNVPMEVKEGGIYFWKTSLPKSKETNVVWFWLGSFVHSKGIGGLAIGQWHIDLYGDKDKRIYSHRIWLESGQILSLQD